MKEEKFAGVLEECSGGGCLSRKKGEDYQRIFISQENLNGAPFGMLVRVTFESDDAGNVSNARVTEVLGSPSNPDSALRGIIFSYDLSETFPDEVLSAASRFPLNLSENRLKKELESGRKDLRELKTLTIDGIDAKDLDDAVSISKNDDGGYTLWVHIADVSNYVKENSILDKEALKRGNSVYLPGEVLPMLPPRLSNGICSLNPKTPRLCLSVKLKYDASGNRKEGEIFESVIVSDLRANYKSVYEALFEGKTEESYQPFMEELELMKELARLLKKKRIKKGCLDFNFPETKVILDNKGRTSEIMPEPVTEANGIIEEFMIAANVFVAEKFREAACPFIYRVHDKPDMAKLMNFFDLCRHCGISIGRIKNITPEVVAGVLKKINKSPLKSALSQALLRSMAKAAYDSKPLGHFGLAEEDYAHFTSPIRRYADLFIHRVIKAVIAQKNIKKIWFKKAASAAEHISETEITAMSAERDVVDLKVAEYMKQHIGELYSGEVSGIIASGFFVRLENSAEGFVPFRYLDDYYYFNEKLMQAEAGRSGHTIRIGSKLDIIVAWANIETRQVDFVPANSFFINYFNLPYNRRENAAEKLRSGEFRLPFRKNGRDERQDTETKNKKAIGLKLRKIPKKRKSRKAADRSAHYSAKGRGSGKNLKRKSGKRK